MPPNRDYYPSPYHQAQFHMLSAQDGEFNNTYNPCLWPKWLLSNASLTPHLHCPASILEERECLGLNSILSKPEAKFYCMPVLFKCAILGLPHQQLTLSELCLTLRQFYEEEDRKGRKTWVVSVMPFSYFSTFILQLFFCQPNEAGCSV